MGRGKGKLRTHKIIIKDTDGGTHHYVKKMNAKMSTIGFKAFLRDSADLYGYTVASARVHVRGKLIHEKTGTEQLSLSVKAPKPDFTRIVNDNFTGALSRMELSTLTDLLSRANENRQLMVVDVNEKQFINIDLVANANDYYVYMSVSAQEMKPAKTKNTYDELPF